MLGRAVLGATLARRPVVVKLVADEAYERARRWGLFDGDLDAFQRFRGGLRVRLLRKARDRALRRVSHLVCPSGYLAALAVDWGVPRERVTVLPNAAPPLPSLPDRDEARAGLGVDGPMLAFAGRVTRQKSLGVALDALAQVDDVSLLIAGDGPDLAEVRRRVRRARPRRPRSVSRVARAQRRAHALSGCRRVAPHVVVGELPAHGRRGARRRDAGDRHTRRRSSGAGARRRERPARRGGRHRGGGRCDRPIGARRRACATGWLRKRPVPSSRSSRKSLYARLEAILAEAAR